MAVRYSRCKTLFGEENFIKLQNTNIIILGVGGVGGHALDCLYRSGITNITIIDYDKYDESNQNRQIGSHAVGEDKLTVLKQLYPDIKTIHQKMDLEWLNNFDFKPFNIIVDSADTTKVKIELAKKEYKKLIMSLGSAKRYDTTKIEVSNIWKSHGDALGKKIRYELKKSRFNKKFTVVFSPEEDKCKDKGSCIAVTGTFGLMICSEVIKRVLK